MFNFCAKFKFWFNGENFGQKFKFLGQNSNFFGEIWRQNFLNSKFSGNLRIAFHSDFQILRKKIFVFNFWREYLKSLKNIQERFSTSQPVTLN